PPPADSTPAGTETLTTERTKLGIVTARATIKGKPVIYTRLRTTYMHETDSGLGFSYFNDPAKVHDAKSFQQAASLIGYTFNWFYVDSRQIAYFNSGYNPVRASRTDPDLPVFGDREWRSCGRAPEPAPTGSTATATAATSTRPRSGSWTPGGPCSCGRSSSPYSAGSCSTRSRA